MLANVRKIFEISCDFIAKLLQNKNSERFKIFFTITSSKFVCRWATHVLASNMTIMNDFCKLLIFKFIWYIFIPFVIVFTCLLSKSNAFECQDAWYCLPICMLLLINGMVITAQVMPFIAFRSCFEIKKQTLIPLKMHIRWVRAYQFFLFCYFSCTVLHVCFSYKIGGNDSGQCGRRIYETHCFPAIHRCPHEGVRCTLFGRCFSVLPEGTANFSAMSFSEEKNKSAIVMAWPHVGCFWAIIKEWKIDACKL